MKTIKTNVEFTVYATDANNHTSNNKPVIYCKELHCTASIESEIDRGGELLTYLKTATAAIATRDFDLPVSEHGPWLERLIIEHVNEYYDNTFFLSKVTALQIIEAKKYTIPVSEIKNEATKIEDESVLQNTNGSSNGQKPTGTHNHHNQFPQENRVKYHFAEESEL